MRRFLVIVGLALGLLAAALDLAAGAVADDVWSRYVISKRRFQNNLHGLLVHKWQDLEPTLVRQHEQQLALLTVRDMQFRWLLENHPDRIVTGAGLEGLAGFEWTDADTDSLRSHNPGFEPLQAFITTANEKLASDPQLDEARRRMTMISSDEDFRAMIKRFDAYLSELEARLAAAE